MSLQVDQQYSDYPFEYYYYYYYPDMHHPQVTNRYDVEGNDNISCENGFTINILGKLFIRIREAFKKKSMEFSILSKTHPPHSPSMGKK